MKVFASNAIAASLNRLRMATFGRSIEYLRDRSSLVRNFVLPLLLIMGLTYTFSGPQTPVFKVAVISPDGRVPAAASHPFLSTPLVQFYAENDPEAAIHKVQLQRIDMALEYPDPMSGKAGRYWINELSEKGSLLERLMAHSNEVPLQPEKVGDSEIRYVDWVVPGVLAINILMSSLFGIGTVVVAYRKSGYLKRLSATPLKPAEFLAAQLISRLLVVLLVNGTIFAVCKALLHLRMAGSYLDLLLLVVLAVLAVASLALLITARTSSEELGTGLLTVVLMLMMVVSGVFFSIDGAPRPIRIAAMLSPLSHLVNGARAIMLDGATLAQLGKDLLSLGATCAACLLAASFTFKWRND